MTGTAAGGIPLASAVPAPPGLPTGLHAAMLAVWHGVPALQRRFPLQRGRTQDHLAFLAWCVAEGRKRYALLREIPAWDAALQRPAALPPLPGDPWGPGYSVAMLLYALARSQFSAAGVWHRAAVRARIAREWWGGQQQARHGPPPADWQRAALQAAFGDAAGLAAALGGPVPPGCLPDPDAVPVARPAAVGLPCLPARPAAWLPLRLRRLALRIRQRLQARPTEQELAGVMAAIPAVAAPEPGRSPHPWGVNLYGYARGEIGIGEDVRMAAACLQAQGIPFCVLNVQPGRNVSQQDRRAEAWIVDAPRYAISLFCITGKEHLRLVCERGWQEFAGRHCIGFWPWELPRWPDSLRAAYSVVHELWGISRYTAAAYAGAPVPVQAQGLAVTVDEAGPQTRADFGLPADAYLYVFAYDLNSTSRRKNPEGVIAAFQRAFPPGAPEPVGLVIKASHTDSHAPAWAALQALARRDPRIHLIGRTLRRPEVLALYRACDCFVSLHRAEGFGRGIAEALLLGKQVVATGWSGNLDFCDPQRVALVPHRRVDLTPDDYFHGAGQHWAEPDPAGAAQALRAAFTAALGDPCPPGDLGPIPVGRGYARRLQQIAMALGLPASDRIPPPV